MSSPTLHPRPAPGARQSESGPDGLLLTATPPRARDRPAPANPCRPFHLPPLCAPRSGTYPISPSGLSPLFLPSDRFFLLRDWLALQLAWLVLGPRWVDLHCFLPSDKGFARTALAPSLEEHSQARGLGGGAPLQTGGQAAASDWLEFCNGLDQSPPALPEFYLNRANLLGAWPSPPPVPRIGLWP